MRKGGGSMTDRYVVTIEYPVNVSSDIFDGPEDYQQELQKMLDKREFFLPPKTAKITVILGE